MRDFVTPDGGPFIPQPSSLWKFLRRVYAWHICFKRPWCARHAWLVASGNGEYRCPCGRCDLPVFPARSAS